jgi:hypothetical protein
MNKLFTIHRRGVIGKRRNKLEPLPVGDYWVSVPEESDGDGILLFRKVSDNSRWRVIHNEWRKGENRGIITFDFTS